MQGCQTTTAAVDLGRTKIQGREIWPAVIQVENAAAPLFQQATKANTKLKGAYNLRDKWVQALRDDSKIVTKKVDSDTAVNISDVLTRCLPSVANLGGAGTLITAA